MASLNSNSGDPGGEPLGFAVQEGLRVSARFTLPAGARACYVLAHGAGAGMHHPFMSAAAEELAALGIATLRYQFPTWSAVRDGPTRRPCVMRRCVPRSRRRRASRRHCRWWPAGARSAAA
jgi:predicted alpha/beta-hydrolase family hydrolase